MELTIQNFGPVKEGKIEFKDITVFVGPQASGKSLSLQLFKLLKDKDFIIEYLEQQNYYPTTIENLFNLYFGENMSSLLTDEAYVSLGKEEVNFNSLVKKTKGRSAKQNKKEKVFYIPAQRVLTIAQGWPKPFDNFDASDPFVIKRFSDQVRKYLTKLDIYSKQAEKLIFPLERKIKSSLRKKIDESIYHNARILSVKRGLRKVLVLKSGDKFEVPFPVWSAGQKEFLALLLSFYLLLPPAKKTKLEYEYVIIEEPEMGMHTRAIMSFLLLVIELLFRGYKIIISSHSVIMLEFIWMLKQLKSVKIDVKEKTDALFKIFGIKKGKDSHSINQMFEAFLKKKYTAYFFVPDKNFGFNIKDITSLDLFEEKSYDTWGELYSFNDIINEVIADLNS